MIAAEAVAYDAAVDHGYFAATSLYEILSGENINEPRRALVVRLATDCRSLYDAIPKENSPLGGRRVLSDHQPADGLTKVMKQLMKRTTARPERPRARRE